MIEHLDGSHAEQPPKAERAPQGGTLYRQLSAHLLKFGRVPDIEQIEEDMPQDSLYCEVTTPNYGTVVITDAALEDTHWDFAGISDEPPDRKKLLAKNDSILTITFVDAQEIWFVAARPIDLQVASDLRRVYQSVSGDLECRGTLVVFFNDKDLEVSPGLNPLLRELGGSL